MNELADIVMIETELFQREQMLNVLDITRDQIVHADHLIALFNKSITEVRTEEAGGTGHENSFLAHGTGL
jgi:hypothetical protein